MLKVDPRCTVCKAVATNKPLLKRIYGSSWFVPSSSDSLLNISRDFRGVIKYAALTNHVKKHQFIDSQDYTEKMLAYADKNAEQHAVRKAVKAVDAVQAVIQDGMDRLESGELKVKSVNELIRASQVKLTHESKQKDQELATIEMVAHFLSGENMARPTNSERINYGDQDIIEVNPDTAPDDIAVR
jgi:hypothetical protein